MVVITKQYKKIHLFLLDGNKNRNPGNGDNGVVCRGGACSPVAGILYGHFI